MGAMEECVFSKGCLDIFELSAIILELSLPGCANKAGNGNFVSADFQNNSNGASHLRLCREDSPGSGEKTTLVFPEERQVF